MAAITVAEIRTVGFDQNESIGGERQRRQRAGGQNRLQNLRMRSDEMDAMTCKQLV